MVEDVRGIVRRGASATRPLVLADVGTAVRAENNHGFPFKGVRVVFGGFGEGAAIYRTKNEASDISSNFSRIPFDNSPLAHTSETRLTGRQSRLSVLFSGDWDKY